MARPTKDQIEARIIAAVTQTAAADGIGATSMAAVARAARVSAGTLYLHFSSKEDMLQQVYLRLKHAFHAQLMQAAHDAPDPRAAIEAMWRALLAFQQADPNAFLFLEYAGAAQVLTEAQKSGVAPLQQEVNAILQRALDAGILTVPSLDIAVTLLIGPALQLARRHALAGTPVPDIEARQTFERIWTCLTLPLP